MQLLYKCHLRSSTFLWFSFHVAIVISVQVLVMSPCQSISSTDGSFIFLMFGHPPFVLNYARSWHNWPPSCFCTCLGFDVVCCSCTKRMFHCRVYIAVVSNHAGAVDCILVFHVLSWYRCRGSGGVRDILTARWFVDGACWAYLFVANCDLW